LGPLVRGFAVLDMNGPKHIMEDGMETNIAKPELVDRNPKVRLTVAADECSRVVGADGEIKEMVDGWAGLNNVSDDDPLSALQRTGLKSRGENDC